MTDQNIQAPSMRDEIRGIIKQAIGLFFFGGIALSLIFGRSMGVTDFGSFVEVAIYQGMIWVALWIGNGMVSNYMTRRWPWLEYTERRFIFGVVAAIVYTVVALTVLIVGWLMYKFGLSFQKAISVLEFDFYFSAILITALISMFLHGREFLKEWRTSASEAERLRNENLKARFETLKNQVNPHFLFNSFNVLSTLVYKDQDQAAKFIKEMSKLYRYVLDTQEKETVTIKEELEALDAFTFLSKMRFGESLHFDINLKEEAQSQIAPMVLQMLVENAIKHNVVSKAKPLTVKIFREGDYIIVQNNLQLKNNVTASTGIGLPNIKARYEYLSDEAVEVQENNEDFKVSIPILNY